MECFSNGIGKPEESVLDDDVWAAGLALLRFVEHQNVAAAAEEEEEL